MPTPPVTHGGVLYLGGQGYGGTVYALDENGGSVRWHSGLFIEGMQVVFAGQTLVAAGLCDRAAGIASTSGDILWQVAGDCDGGGAPMSSYDGSRVWSEDSWGGDGADTSTLYDPTDGGLTGHFSGYAPAFGYGEAVDEFLGGNNGPTEIRALDPNSRAARWSFNQPADKEAVTGSAPLLADGSVFAEGPEGQVWALDPCTGAVQWRSQVTAPPEMVYQPLKSLAAGDGYLVVPTDDGLTRSRAAGRPPPFPIARPGPSNLPPPSQAVDRRPALPAADRRAALPAAAGHPTAAHPGPLSQSAPPRPPRPPRRSRLPSNPAAD